MTKTTYNVGATHASPLPDGWRWVKLEEVCEFQYGSGLIQELRQGEGNIPVYGSNGVVGYHDTALTAGPTIIIGRKGSIGEVHFSSAPCFPIDTTYFVDSVKLPVYLEWLAYILQTLRLPKLNKASGVPGLNRNDVYKLKITLPPFSEQQRLTRVLREQMAAVEKARTAAKARLEAALALPVSFVNESLTTGLTRRYSLDDCLIEVRNGIGAEWSKYPVLGATREGLAPAKEGVGKAPGRYKLVDPVTVFYNPMRILLGSIAMVDEGDTPGITSPDYVVVKGRPGILDTRWFYHWFRSAYGAHLVESLSRGAVRERILYNRLSAGEIDLPDYNVQKRVSEGVRHTRDFIEPLTKELDTINALPAALLRRAFNGGL